MSEFVVSINSRKYVVKIFDDGNIEVNGKPIRAELSLINNQAYLLKYGNKVFEAAAEKLGSNRFGLLIEGWYYDAVVRTRLQENANELLLKKNSGIHKTQIKAPMPGLIMKILYQKGNEVKKGDPLFILEAMKMENEVRSTSNGIIKEVYVKEGDAVEKDSLILVLE